MTPATAAAPSLRRPDSSTRRQLAMLDALVRRELTLKYKRSVLGFAWSLLAPAAMAGIFLFVFAHVYRASRDDFVLYLLTGLLPWQFFISTTVIAAGCLALNGGLLRQVAFPPVLLPLATVLSQLVTFLLGLAVVLVLLAAFGRAPSVSPQWLVVAIVLELLFCGGLGLIVSIAHLYFRDVAALIGVSSTALLFCTPVVYDLAQVPDRFRPWFRANPLVGILESYRAGLFDSRVPDTTAVIVSALVTLAILVVGWLLFRRHAPNVAKEV
jgi:lipopolysaccharide transport system permease protein